MCNGIKSAKQYVYGVILLDFVKCIDVHLFTSRLSILQMAVKTQIRKFVKEMLPVKPTLAVC